MKKSLLEVNIDFVCDFGAKLARFGRHFGRPGRLWAHLGASWARLGASWRPLGASLAHLVRHSARLGASWRVLGASGHVLGASWRVLARKTTPNINPPAVCQMHWATPFSLARFSIDVSHPAEPP